MYNLQKGAKAISEQGISYKKAEYYFEPIIKSMFKKKFETV